MEDNLNKIHKRVDVLTKTNKKKKKKIPCPKNSFKLFSIYTTTYLIKISPIENTMQRGWLNPNALDLLLIKLIK